MAATCIVPTTPAKPVTPGATRLLNLKNRSEIRNIEPWLGSAGVQNAHWQWFSPEVGTGIGFA
jgi:hypothetical protein